MNAQVRSQGEQRPSQPQGAVVAVRIRYFASIREAVGQGQEGAQTSSATLGALRDELIARGEPYASALARGKAVRMALDQDMSDESAALREGCEVAFFPPVTGG
jgi:sulfur-carrier protein